MMMIGSVLILGALAPLAQAMPAPTVTCGFRHDPLPYVNRADTVQATLIRRHVLQAPKPGDEAILQARIEEILSEQEPSGLIGGSIKDTCDRLLQLIELGVDPQRAEVQRILELVRAEECDEDGDNFGTIQVRGVRALCQLGLTDDPKVQAAAQQMIDRREVWDGPYKLCPWGQELYLEALWDARDIVDSEPVVREVLTWITDRTSDAGCLTYKDPYGFVQACGVIDLPEAGALLRKLLPVILRGQREDGSWGDHHTFPVIRALALHGLLDDLREADPLPLEWRLSDPVDLPSGARHLAFGDGLLWTALPGDGQVVGLSPEDGTIARRLPLAHDNTRGLAWAEGKLWITLAEPNRLLVLDAEAGGELRCQALEGMEWIGPPAMVDGELWIADYFMGAVAHFDPTDPGKPEWSELAGPSPGPMATVDGSMWHIDGFSRLIIESDPGGGLRSFAERPFLDEDMGIASDGETLWLASFDRGRVWRAHRVSR
jgi:hypothetical protein